MITLDRTGLKALYHSEIAKAIEPCIIASQMGKDASAFAKDVNDFLVSVGITDYYTIVNSKNEILVHDRDMAEFKRVAIKPMPNGTWKLYIDAGKPIMECNDISVMGDKFVRPIVLAAAIRAVVRTPTINIK